jgi:hypothetical protein
MIAIAHSLTAGGAGIGYLLKEDFSTDLAAGSVNGTTAVPGPGGDRAVVDTESKLSLSSGSLAINGGKAVPAEGDPGIWWPEMTRTAGLMLILDLTTGATNVRTLAGWDSAQLGPPNRHSFYFYSDGTLRAYDVAANLKFGIDYTADTNYKLALVLRATGAFYFVRISSSWELVFVSDSDANAAVYPCITNRDMVVASSFVRVPSKLWLPAAVVSDAFEATAPAPADQGDNDISLGMSGPVAFGAEGIGDGNTAAFFNATDACLTLGCAAFDDVFSGDKGTAFCYAKIRAAADWGADGVYRYPFHARDADADTNYVVMGKSGAANTLCWRHRSGGLVHDLTHDFSAGGPTTDWFSQAMTWDTDVPELIAYVDGSAVESPMGTIEPMEPRNWSAPGTNVIGAGSLTQQEWPGSIAHMILGYGQVATAAQILAIHDGLAAGTLTTSDPDEIFGEGNWSWWKLDEQFETDGAGHPEASGLGSGGSGKKWTQQVGFWTVQNDQAEVANLIDSKAIATVDAGSADVVVSAKLTRSAGEVGIVARYQDGDNCLWAFHDGTNAKLMQRVLGAQSTLFSAARAYAAGATMRLLLSGQRAVLTYNGEVVNAQPTPVAAGLTSANVGLYSSDAGNVVDDFCVLRAGTAGEHEELKKYE